jgi:hypothetical protein
MITIMTKIINEEPLSEEEVEVMAAVADDTIKDGVATTSISLIGPNDINSLDDLIGNMIIINEDGTYRFADDYDISLFFNIPVFYGIPCGFTMSSGGQETVFAEL